MWSWSTVCFATRRKKGEDNRSLSIRKRLGKCNHVVDERHAVCGCEWPHHFAIVRFDVPSQSRDCTRNTGLGDQGEQTQHCEATIVNLNVELVSFLLFCQVIVESEWVVQAERVLSESWVIP